MSTAVEYNRRRQQRGKFLDEEIAKLVLFLQTQAGFEGDDLDGKFGPKTRDALEDLGLTLPVEMAPGVVQVEWDEGPKWLPTPNPEIWKGWVYPIPILPGGHEPVVSSGFAQYGKGPNAKGRPNHWGADLMYLRHPDDEGPPVRKDKYDRWTGGRMPPTHSVRHYCPHGTDVWAAGPGTVWSTGYDEKRGLSVTIDHHNVPGFGPLTTWYQHLHEVFVEKGDELEAGELIGTLGESSLVHLHFEFRDYNREDATKPGLSASQRRARAVVNPAPYLDLFEKRSLT